VCVTGERQFFEGINQKTGENILRWMNKNMDAKTKNFVQDYITQKEKETEETKAENRRRRRVQSLEAELKRTGKLKEFKEEMNIPARKKITVGDYLDFQRKKKEEKAGKELEKTEERRTRIRANTTF
jgi:hypothetical protein